MIDVMVPLEQEGTTAVVSGWLRQVGDRVALNDPLVELETDKVSVEVPAPAEGVVAEILLSKGDEAKPGQVLARLRPVEEMATPAPVPEASDDAAREVAQPAGKDRSGWFSPAVRKALAETGMDPRSLRGTGRDGRLTLADVERAARAPRAAEPVAMAPAVQPQPSTPDPANGRSTSVPHDSMRQAIARNMLKSVTEAPHVTAVFEADFSAIIAHRARHKAAMAQQGIALTYTAYLLAASARAMAAVPQVNARWHDDRLEMFGDINIGIGTALGDKGLVVPVIRRVQDLSLSGVAASLQDATTRARDGHLRPEDVRGGSFTISNHGVSGSLFAAPIIINQPQVAILGVGRLEKRVVVREAGGVDTIQIRPMAYVSLSIDHRALDAHQANGWLSAFVAALEDWRD
ncbi:dihydrolipoamide acetyltransferase family protein [Paracoccus sulfuroxidans]|uniref:Dihydrolipoamide acetyltransferase component of pyruvate dehydrogenase complex n=1 Tax=Paracoccus sulfuroxidans TaxID=384678 RepID=A0A562NQ51_9RHOB|nr:2-oxo acid dehydrogenase subunit E2 [Paracoccus sulfuroxidans]TWI34329.1 2-oxoglutarate dehydrogenase E2 component (dihydrolipoamide succinyltransferase) [Paracoccus sulfuroxidans]